MAIFFVAQQSGHAGRRGEVGPTKPVDRSLVADESGGLTVADKGVVLNARRHRWYDGNSELWSWKVPYQRSYIYCRYFAVFGCRDLTASWQALASVSTLL